MNTPASSATSSSASDSGNGASPPSTPIREHKVHRTVRNTYGRAKPPMYTAPSSTSSSFSLDSPSSPDPWGNYSISLESNPNSPLQQRTTGRSRLSGSFSELSTKTTPNTPSRGTRTLTEKLARAKLDLLDSDSDNDDNNEKNYTACAKKEDIDDEKNVFLVRNSKRITQEREDTDVVIDNTMNSPKGQTPKRKRQALEVAATTAVRQSPRTRKTIALDIEKTQDLDSDLYQDTSKGRLRSLGRISPRSLSPESPPGSPSDRSSKRSRIGSMPVVVIPAVKTTTTTTNSSNGSSAGTEKKQPQQATLAAFFAPKAGSRGTGILKGRTSALKEIPSTGNASNTIPKPDNTLAKNPSSSSSTTATSTSKEPAKKLEQLFLSFSKDRTKSTAKLSSSEVTPSNNRKPVSRLKRDDEKSKRYHCPQCGMPFVRGQSEDEQIHDRYHRAVLGGIDYPGYKNEIVVATFNDLKIDNHQQQQHVNKSSGSNTSGNGASTSANELFNSRIVMISMSDSGKSASSLVSSGGSSFEKRKVKEVLQVVNKELGSVDFEPEQLDSCKVFLYISGKKKVIGCVIAERIKQGFEILSHAESASSTSSSTESLTPESSTNIASTPTLPVPELLTDHERGGGGSAIFCSTVPRPAICGINRIWVSSHCRRQGIASRLLEAVRARFIYACKLKKTDLAFSQPTGDGKALARQYLEMDKFLVYVE